MRIKLTAILWILVGVGAPQAQVSTTNFVVQYSYDDAGNRITRAVIDLSVGARISYDTLAEPHAQEEQNEFINQYEPEQAVVIESVLDDANVKIYPNPVTETLVISITKFSTDYTSEISVYDMSGRLLQQQTNSSRYAPISFMDYSSGTYVVRIKVNNDQKEWLIVKK